MVVTLGSKHIKTMDTVLAAGARYLLTSFLRTMNELPTKQSNAAAERAGDERLDIQAYLSWRQPAG